MAAISSLSGAQSVAQSGLQQFRLQQAQRDADQAEQTASALQAQARDAERSAVAAQDNARSIAAQANQAEVNAGQARLGLAVIRTAGQVQNQVSSAISNVTGSIKSVEPAAIQAQAVPVINTQGQVTGTVVNTTA